jgi:hypothetical protein
MRARRNYYFFYAFRKATTGYGFPRKPGGLLMKLSGLALSLLAARIEVFFPAEG